MGYDAGDGYTLLFGGWNQSNGSVLGVTWIFEGGQWATITPATHPPPLAFVEEETPYDSVDHYLLMFGGSGPNSASTNETWIWGAPVYPVSITTVPASVGSVEVDHFAYANGGTAYLPNGSFSIAGVPPAGYFVESSSTSGGVTISGGLLVVLGRGGGLQYTFDRFDRLTFVVVPVACGPIQFNGSSFGNGSSGLFAPRSPASSALHPAYAAVAASLYR